MERVDRQPAKRRELATPVRPARAPEDEVLTRTLVPRPVRMPRADQPQRPARFLRPALRPGWMSALAAGIVICGLLLWPRGDGLLRAETLLLKASNAAAHSPSRAKSHLRIKTRTASFIRPAILGNGAGPDGMDAVRSRFQAAHYDFADPLNPAAFGEWRNSLRNKTDKVAVTAREQSGDPKEYTIDTTTQAPVLGAAIVHRTFWNAGAHLKNLESAAAHALHRACSASRTGRP